MNSIGNRIVTDNLIVSDNRIVTDNDIIRANALFTEGHYTDALRV